jgi:DNA-binding CsgD family transcriptional regulator
LFDHSVSIHPPEGVPVTAPTAAPPSPPVPGGPASAALVRRVSEAPTAPLTAVVVGPGGTGKTTLLDAVGHAYATAGVEVARALPATPTAALLVDDAHRLDADAVARLRAFADDPRARLVIAHRPWPRPAGPLPGVAGRRVVVVVGHLTRDAVAARIAGRVGVTPPEAMVDVVHEQSGGLPALVEIVTRALHETGRFDARRPDTFRRPDLITVSAALAERLRHHVDALDPDVRALLEAMAVGAALDGEVLGPLLDTPAEHLSGTVEAARATGLLTDAGALIPFVRGLLLRLTPVLRARELQRRLAGIELDRGGSVLHAGRQLLGTGASGSRIAAVLRAAADEAPAELAADLLDEAVRAGLPSTAVAGRRARALALAGELDAALRVADTAADGPEHEDATLVAAAVLAHRGLLTRSIELYRGVGGPAALLAVPGLVVTGAVDAARDVLDGVTGGGRLLDGAAELMARGMLATVEGTAPAALSLLARAGVLLDPVAAATLLPDTPAALTAVVALQCGELSLAQEAVHRAATRRHGGRAAQPRLRLLHGWALMCRGRFDLARRTLRTDTEPEPRDELLAAALAAALARRAADPAALATAWGRARDALVRQPVDLTTLPQLGELAVATAELGEDDWLAPHLHDADALLDRLGGPVLWGAPLRWYRLQAALAAGRDTEVGEHAEALQGVALQSATGTPYGAVLAAAAGCWADLVAGRVDADAVVAVGRRMPAVGLGWEGAQLAGRAALLTDDRRVTSGLHATARALHTEAPDAVTDAPQPGFTERELEIGRHVLAGLTYKQIGTRLYLSAKTVEHHVARMRQRSGAGSRDELFGLLRAALDEQPG